MRTRVSALTPRDLQFALGTTRNVVSSFFYHVKGVLAFSSTSGVLPLLRACVLLSATSPAIAWIGVVPGGAPARICFAPGEAELLLLLATSPLPVAGVPAAPPPPMPAYPRCSASARFGFASGGASAAAANAELLLLLAAPPLPPAGVAAAPPPQLPAFPRAPVLSSGIPAAPAG